MQTILHIGGETGGETILPFLSANRRLLRQAGYLVPDTLGGANRQLVLLCKPSDHSDDLTRRLGLADTASFAAAQSRWRQDFLGQVRAERPDTLLISARPALARLRKPGEIAALRDLLAEVSDHITIIVYLSDPLAIATMLYEDRIKSGLTEPKFPRPVAPQVQALADHAATLSAWIGAFGAAALRPRLFQPGTLSGGTLLADFRAASGLPDLGYALPPPPAPPLSPFGLEVLRHFNAHVPPKLADGADNPARRGIFPFFQSRFPANGPHLPPEALRQAYDAAFASSNEWVRRHYFPQRDRLFDAPLQAVAPDGSPEQADAASTAATLAELWLSGGHSAVKPDSGR